MKKSLFKLFSLTLALLMLTGALSSCMRIGLAVLGEEKDALLILSAFEKANASSYSIHSESKMTVAAGKKDTNSVTVTGDMVVYKANSKDFRFHMEQKTETVLSGSYTKMETLEGFQNDKMYTGYDQASDSSYLYSEISRKDYTEHMEEMELLTDFEFDITQNNCSDISCVTNNDKTVTASFKSFTDAGMEQFFELLDTDPETFGDLLEVDDFELTLTVDKKLRPKTLRLDILFDVSEDYVGEDPSMYLEMTFDLDGVEAPEDLDLSEYEQVEDLRLVDRVEKQLEEMVDQEEGYFSTKVVQKVTSGNQSQYETTLYNGVYRTEDDTYTHEIKVTDGDTIYKTGKLVYEDGKQEAFGIVAELEKSMSDYEAKAFLASLLNPADFDSSVVSNITPDEETEGVYLISLADPKGNQPLASALSMEARV